MIIIFDNYFDQTQMLGLMPILRYNGYCEGVETPYPLLMILTQKTEYNMTLSKSVEYNMILSHRGGGI